MSSELNDPAPKRRHVRTRALDEEEVAEAFKDTLRWCRGQEGVEHTPECRDYATSRGSVRVGTLGILFKGWKSLVCVECGRELETYYPFGKAKDSPPSWVK